MNIIEYLTLLGNQILKFVFDFLGPYSTWSYEDKTADNYCEYNPFMLALGFLITGWILLFVILLVFCYAFIFCGEDE